MAIFNGRYSWDGTKKNDLDPISWYPGAYDVKIFDYSLADGKVMPLKKYICLYARTGEGQSISANPEKFAQRICSEFSLDIERVLWVEDLLTEEERFDIIFFKYSRKVGKEYFYRTEKRKALAPEVKLIQQALADVAGEMPAPASK